MADLTGRINVTFGCLRVLAADMHKNGTPDEQIAGQLLQCVEAAVKAGEGAELLNLMQKWMQQEVERMTGELKDMAYDDYTYADMEE